MTLRTNTDWSIGLQLRVWREAVGLEQQEAAPELGVSQQSVSTWENDAGVPRAATARLLDRVYELSPGMAAAVIGGESPPAGLVEPRAVDIDAQGQLVWSARYLVRDVPAQRRFSAVS